MPYNNTPIVPPTEYTGTVSLPLARVKKIVHADEEVMNCSNSAAFVITVATEMFIQYMAERTHDVVKAEKKPRRNIQYRDVANAVSRVDNLEFLTDVVPKTMTWKQAKAVIAQNQAAAAPQLPLASGQTTLPGAPVLTSVASSNTLSQEREEQDGVDEMQVEARSSESRGYSEQQQQQLEMRGRRTNGEARGSRVGDLVTNGHGSESDL